MSITLIIALSTINIMGASNFRRPKYAELFKQGPPKGTTLLNNPEEWLMANTFTADEQCRLQHGKDAKAKIVEDSKFHCTFVFLRVSKSECFKFENLFFTVCSPWVLQC